MPTVQCPRCKKTVRFEGVAGVCPNCASVVRAAAPAAATPESTGDRPGRSRKPSRGTQAAPDLNQIAEPEHESFAPASSDHHGHGHHIDKKMLFWIIGGVAAVLLIGLIIILIPKSADVQAITVKPTPPVRPPAVETQDDSTAPPPPPPVFQPQPTSAPAFNPTSRPTWANLKPVKPKLAESLLTDKIVDTTLRNGVAYLKKRFTGGQLHDIFGGDEVLGGGNSLAVYSLMHAGEAMDDSDLSKSSPFMKQLLDKLRSFDMKGGKATYERSLRAQAYSMANRPEDQDGLRQDLAWLMRSEVKGAYGYTMPPIGDDKKMPEVIDWDNSNTQYGLLGVWAASMAGASVADKYWADVETHWTTCQSADGGWPYKPNEDSRISMTCAGVTSLCVAAEQQAVIATKGHKDHPKMTDAINKGVKWMSDGNHLTVFDSNAGYDLYGVERAALATGFRYFGTHDWYRELGVAQLKLQEPEGAWDGINGREVETSFRLLFYARGLQPILVDKLRFNGDWNDRPRDAAKLTQFVSSQLEKPFAWGVADLGRDPSEWLESPLLLITTDADPHFTDEEFAKLREYADEGGLIFLHNEFASKEVDAFAQDLARKVFPEYPMTKAADDDFIYTTAVPMKKRPPMQVVGNGSRTLMVYSPTDITKSWLSLKAKDLAAKNDPNLQMGQNLFLSTAGKNGFRSRLNSPAIPEPQFPPIGEVPIARITYGGRSNPEPGAWKRFGRYFMNETSIKLNVIDTQSKDLDIGHAPIAILTGNSDADLGQLDAKAIHDYVAAGGTLIVDATGGSKEFVAGLQEKLMPVAFPGGVPTAIPPTHPFLSASKLACGDALPKAHLRAYASLVNFKGVPPVAYLTVDRGTVILSDLDLTTGLLASGTYAINGYTPDYCQSLLKNVVLWTLQKYN